MILVLLVNYVADQFVQLNPVKGLKYSSVFALIIHVATWFIPMTMLTLWHISAVKSFDPLKYLMILTAIHFVADYVCGLLYETYMDKDDYDSAIAVLATNSVIMNCAAMWCTHACIYCL